MFKFIEELRCRTIAKHLSLTQPLRLKTINNCRLLNAIPRVYSLHELMGIAYLITQIIRKGKRYQMLKQTLPKDNSCRPTCRVRVEYSFSPQDKRILID